MRIRLILWMAVFTYALLAGFAIQIIVLPYIFPDLNDGAGLLVGHDWNGFHIQAVEQANRIAQLGWQEFRLRPDGENVITGLCSLLYYFFQPKPWTLLPINAAMFATAALALFLLVKFLGLSDRNAAIAISPFVFFPSSAIQFSQIHKDVFCAAGMLVTLWCWVSLLQPEIERRKIAVLVFVSTLAIGIVWLFRPYFMQILLYWNGALVAWYFFAGVVFFVKSKASDVPKLSGNTIAFYARSVMVMLMLLGVTYQYYSSYLDLRFASPEAITNSEEANKFFNRQGASVYGGLGMSVAVVPRSSLQSAEAAQTSESGSADLDQFLANAAKYKQPVVVLKEGAPIENFVNKTFLKLAVARGGFTNSGKNAATNIDRDVVFYKPEDLVRYVPRALQIGFLAPFPQILSAVESQKSNRTEIRISVTEMLLCYVAFLGWIYWAIHIRKTGASLWIPALVGLSVILLMGLTVANIGTLYRLRFPFFMIFVTFGVAGLLQFLSRKSRRVGEK